MRYFIKGIVGVLISVMILIGCASKEIVWSEILEDGGIHQEAKSNKVMCIIPSSWANDGYFEILTEKWYEKTGNEVELQMVEDEQYDSIVKAKLASKSGIDIFWGDYRLYDVTETMVEVDIELFEDIFYEEILEGIKYVDGNYYGYPVPPFINSFGVFYNTKVFKKFDLKIPTNFEEMDEVCEVLQNEGIIPIYFSGKDGWTLLQYRNVINGIITSIDKEVWKKLSRNEIKWGEINEFVNQTRELENWVNKGYINENFMSCTYEDAQEALVQGEAAMVYQGSWIASEIYKKYQDAEIDFFPAPNTYSMHQVVMSVNNGGGAHIAKSSKAKNEAEEFLRFLMDPKNVELYFEKQPTVLGIKESKVVEKLPQAFRTIQEYMDTGEVVPHGDDLYKVPLPTEMLSAIYQELLLGKIDPPMFIQKIDRLFQDSGKQAFIPGF